MGSGFGHGLGGYLLLLALALALCGRRDTFGAGFSSSASCARWACRVLGVPHLSRDLCHRGSLHLCVASAIVIVLLAVAAAIAVRIVGRKGASAVCGPPLMAGEFWGVSWDGRELGWTRNGWSQSIPRGPVGGSVSTRSWADALSENLVDRSRHRYGGPPRPVPRRVINVRHTHPCAHGMYVLEGNAGDPRRTLCPGSSCGFRRDGDGAWATPERDVTVLFITNKPFEIHYQ